MNAGELQVGEFFQASCRVFSRDAESAQKYHRPRATSPQWLQRLPPLQQRTAEAWIVAADTQQDSGSGDRSALPILRSWRSGPCESCAIGEDEPCGRSSAAYPPATGYELGPR